MMHETHTDDIWREEEHEDSCSCSSHPHLVSSSSTEIITVPADPVPLELGVVDRTFLMERLLSAIQHNGTVNVQQYVNRMERIGGASGSDTDTDTAAVRYIDDTVQIQNSDTDLASQTLQTQDSGVVQAQDTQDTQDN